MYESSKKIFQGVLEEIKGAGLWKTERELESPQGAEITVQGKKLLNFCSNNYLGLADDARVQEVAHESLKQWGYGLSSVRFICGTQTIHHELEKKLALFLGMDDALLYSSCFDANTGLFETLLTDEDVIISDALNHASIIDGVRLCKAERRRYANNSMEELEKHLQETQEKRIRLIVTDGVFSMDGSFANIKAIVDLAKQYNALVMVDDSHATGIVGSGGRGSADRAGVLDQVDILTSTFGKAIGAPGGGFTAGRKEIIDLLRQRSRPYLFSNSLAPFVVAATIHTLDMVLAMDDEREALAENASYVRERMTGLGFTLKSGEHPIIPVMIGDAVRAGALAKRLFEEGIYVVAFWYPVVPQDTARIRLQISAAHTREQIDVLLSAFERVGKELGIIS